MRSTTTTSAAAAAADAHASCAAEPITHPERIQSFGFLIALTADWVVARASANLDRFLGMDAESAIGMPLERLIAHAALQHLHGASDAIAEGATTERLYGLKLTADGDLHDLALHVSDGLFIVEGEPSGRDQSIGAASLIRAMMRQLQSQNDLSQFHNEAVRQVRGITGFDRALIYHFLPDGSGQVIAEAVSPAAEVMFGLHYPASDIPQQARNLYLRNAFRIIADVGSTPVPLIASRHLAAVALLPLDLSLAVTRAVSPAHIQYLRDMGVVASLSISIIVDGVLWGLIVCHHHVPRCPNFVMRSATELFGAMFSLALQARLHAAAAAHDERTRTAVAAMMVLLSHDERLLDDPAWLHARLNEIIACDGVLISNRGLIAVSGDAPDTLDLTALMDSLDTAAVHVVVATDPPFTASWEGPYLTPPAGILAIPIERAPRDYVMLFRRPHAIDRCGGGDPDAIVAHTGSSTRDIGLRTDFGPFLRAESAQSLRFSRADCRAAEAIRVALTEAALREAQRDAQGHRHLAERREVVIEELNHRVRNILTLIRGLIGRTAIAGVGTADYVVALGGRVQALARAHDHATRPGQGPVALSLLIEDEIAAFSPTARDRFRLFGPTVYLAPSAFSTLALVLHELVTNSIKYGALSADGSIELLAVVDTGRGLDLRWRERGGPAVAQPSRRGFGSVIIESMIAFDLQGTATARYPVSGFEADLFIPERHCARAPAVPEMMGRQIDDHDPIVSDCPLIGRTVLLIEDNMIIAFEAEALLLQLGADRVLIATDLEEAAFEMTQQRVDLAMIDIGIGDMTSIAFARALMAAQVPFFFASGFGKLSLEDSDLGHIVRIRKPYGLNELHKAVNAVLAS